MVAFNIAGPNWSAASKETQMPVRHATANWNGSLKEGSGKMHFADYEGPFTFGSRFESAAGTNPEELIGAAIAGCFSMALSGDLGDAGYKPGSISTESSVEVRPKTGGGFAITKIHLVTKAAVPGIKDDEFQKIAAITSKNCPVSTALAAVPITLDASLS
jgi:lipoyl-dependent peroxiredoxin